MGRTLDDLQVIRFGVSDVAFAAWKKDYARHNIRIDRLRRDAKALYGLILLSGPTGQTTASLQQIGRFIGLTDDAVERAVSDLIEAGVIAADKPLITRRSIRLKGYRDREKGWIAPRRIWIEPPRIMITPPDLWAVDLPRMTLGNWLDNPPTEDAHPIRELIEENDRSLEIADAFAKAGSVGKVASQYDLTPRRVREMPEVKTMIGLRQAVRDLLIIVMASFGLKPPFIAKTLTSRGIKVSPNTVRRVLAHPAQHAPRWAWESLMEDEEIAWLTIAALDRHNQAAADRLFTLLYRELRPDTADVQKRK